MTGTDYTDFQALDPFFQTIVRGLDGLADGEHFFDLYADDAVTEYVVTVPDYPKQVNSRAELMELYRGYGHVIQLEGSGELRRYHDKDASVVILEYSCHGKIVSTGAGYSNRYVSITTIKDRKIIHWRDYLDPLAVVQALGGAVPTP